MSLSQLLTLAFSILPCILLGSQACRTLKRSLRNMSSKWHGFQHSFFLLIPGGGGSSCQSVSPPRPHAGPLRPHLGEEWGGHWEALWGTRAAPLHRQHRTPAAPDRLRSVASFILLSCLFLFTDPSLYILHKLGYFCTLFIYLCLCVFPGDQPSAAMPEP